jgi:hypothetical protein
MKVFPRNASRSDIRENYLETNVPPFQNAMYMFVGGKLSAVALSSHRRENQIESITSLVNAACERRWGKSESIQKMIFTGYGSATLINEVKLWKASDRHAILFATTNYVAHVIFDPTRVSLSEFMPNEGTIQDLEMLRHKRERKPN